MLILEKSPTQKELSCFDVLFNSDFTTDARPIFISYEEAIETLNQNRTKTIHLLENTGVFFKLKRGIGEMKLIYSEAIPKNVNLQRNLITTSNYNWCIRCLTTPTLATKDTIHENMNFSMFPIFEKGTVSDNRVKEVAVNVNLNSNGRVSSWETDEVPVYDISELEVLFSRLTIKVPENKHENHGNKILNRARVQQNTKVFRIMENPEHKHGGKHRGTNKIHSKIQLNKPYHRSARRTRNDAEDEGESSRKTGRRSEKVDENEETVNSVNHLINMNEINRVDEIDAVTGKSTSTFFLDLFVDFDNKTKAKNFGKAVKDDIEKFNSGKNASAKFASISALWDTGASANLIPVDVVKKYLPQQMKNIIKTPTAEIVGANKSKIETLGKIILDFSMAAYPLRASPNGKQPQEVRFRKISFYVCRGIARTIVGEQVIHFLNDTEGVLFSQAVGKIPVPRDHMVIGLANTTNVDKLRVIRFYKNKPTTQFTSGPNTMNIPVNHIFQNGQPVYSEVFSVEKGDNEHENTRHTFQIFSSEMEILQPNEEKIVSIKHNNDKKLEDGCNLIGFNDSMDIRILDRSSARLRNTGTVCQMILENEPIALVYGRERTQAAINEIYEILNQNEREYDGKYPLSESIISDPFEREVEATDFEVNRVDMEFAHAVEKFSNIKDSANKMSKQDTKVSGISEKSENILSNPGSKTTVSTKPSNGPNIDYMKQKFEDPTKVFDGIQKYGQYCQTLKDPQWVPTKDNKLKWNQKGLNKTQREKLGIQSFPKEHPMLTMDKEIASSSPKAYKHLYFPPGVMSKSKNQAASSIGNMCELIEPKNTALAELITGWKTRSSEVDPSLSILSIPYKDQTFDFNFDEKNCSRKDFNEFMKELLSEGLLEPFYIKKNSVLPKIFNQQASITLKPKSILSSRSFPLPLGEVGEHLQELIRHYCKVDLFEKCTASIVNPVMAVRKPGRSFERDKEGKVVNLLKCYRIVMCMENVNQCTVYDNIKPTDPRDVINSLKFKPCINVFDLASAFWQIDLDKTVRKYFAFHIPRVGTVASTRAVQGAVNSAQTLKRILDDIFGELFLKINGNWFIDDASWGSNNACEAKAQIKEFLKIALKWNVKLDSSKAQFMVRKANILGERVSASGLEIQRKHIDHLNDLKTPKSVKDLMSVTGVLSFHQHRSPKIALGLSMLYTALKENNKSPGKFLWSKTQETKLRELVDVVINADKKSFLLPDKGQTADEYPIIFSSDAGAGGVGICVSQIQPENIELWMKMGPQKGEKKVLRLLDVYARRFKESERSWSIFRREITALAACSLKFEYYFNQPNCMKFCRVDSRSIAFCINAANKSTVFHEFLYRLECDYRPIAIVWTEREFNSMADWLSKLGGNDFEPNRSLGWLELMKKQGELKTIDEEQQVKEEDEINEKLRRKNYTKRVNQSNLKILHKFAPKHEDINRLEAEHLGQDAELDQKAQFRFDEEYIKHKTKQPKRSTREIMEKFHDEFHLTHTGLSNIFKSGNLTFNEQELEEITDKCEICSKIRGDRRRIKETPEILELSTGPFAEVAIDTIKGLMKDGAKSSILVARCTFSNYLLAQEISDTTSDSVTQVLTRWCRDVWQVMPVFSGDNAAEFRSKSFYKFCKKYNTRVTPKPTYSPQLNEVERGIREIQERLERHQGQSWVEVLGRIIPSLNLAPSVVLGGRSPAEIVYNRSMNVGKFIGIPNSDNFLPSPKIEDFEEFRRMRQDFKITKQSKRKIDIGSKVFCRNGVRSWGSDQYKVVHKSKKTVGITRIGSDKSTDYVTRHYNDVKLC